MQVGCRSPLNIGDGDLENALGVGVPVFVRSAEQLIFGEVAGDFFRGVKAQTKLCQK